jgi:UDP-N-acetyl-D-galactosamine dehydrogenase
VYQQLLNKTLKISVLGLGYVGLPLALALAKRFSVLGFDINAERIRQMQAGMDPAKELLPDDFEGADILFTADERDLAQAHFHIVAVPTPIDEHKNPDLGPLLLAAQVLSKALKKGDYVVLESTVYPGCMEEDFLPVLEKNTGLKAGIDFKYGYSPERINPGDREHRLEKILKVVSGNDAEALAEISAVYGAVIEAGVYQASSVKVAEAAKVIENTQRDLNIAFMNELAIIFDQMGISTREVLAAAGTKWNFLPFRPGLVGGHCIGVDPYYLLHKAVEIGYNPQVITSGRKINDEMPAYIAKRLVQMLIQAGKNPGQCKVLVMGLTFKENVSDIRNSKVADLIAELNEFSLSIDVHDPLASAQDVEKEYGLTLMDQPGDNYDAIVLAVAHNAYKSLDLSFFSNLSRPGSILFDLKGIFQAQEALQHGFTYWSL